MSEEKESGSVGGVFSSIFPSLPKEIRYAIGGMIVFFLFQMMIYGLVYLPKAFKKYSESVVVPIEHCWILQKIEGQLFKVNSCTGAVEILSIPKALEAGNASNNSFKTGSGEPRP